MAREAEALELAAHRSNADLDAGGGRNVGTEFL